MVTKYADSADDCSQQAITKGESVFVRAVDGKFVRSNNAKATIVDKGEHAKDSENNQAFFNWKL